MVEEFLQTHVWIIKPSTKVDVAIPSWHINGHGAKCRKDFCLGYMKGAGRTCGEEVEISWSHTNPLAPSVREMAPGARHDTLNDHWNGWNFQKIIGFHKCDWFYFFIMNSHLFIFVKELFLRNISRRPLLWAWSTKKSLTNSLQHFLLRLSKNGYEWWNTGKLIQKLQIHTKNQRTVSLFN